jgi:hypothetical protein
MKNDEMHPVPPDMDEPPAVTLRTASAVLDNIVAEDDLSSPPPTTPPTEEPT